MSHPVTIPAVGESVSEGVLSRWLVASGTWVEVDQPIFELETDKISTEVPAPIAGILTHSAGEGDTVAIGATIGDIAPGSKPASLEPGPSSEPAAKAVPSESGTRRVGMGEPGLSPAVKQLVADHGLDPDAITGSGPAGRITKGDVLEHLAASEHAEAQPAAARTPTGTHTNPAISALSPKTNSSAASKTAPTPAPAADQALGEVTRKRMTPLRQRIAQRLVQAQRTAAMLTTFNEIDMAPAMALRSRYKEAFQEKHGVGLGFMSFFVRAAVAALQRYPEINSRVEGNEIVTPREQHVGVAVGTDKGLVVPVIRKAHSLGFAGIESTIRDFAKRAREGKLTIADMDGGTFTISNGGVYGSLMSTPILNPPQSGILGMHTIKERPVAVDGQVVIRPMMYVALSYDHRIVDGSGAVGFLVTIKNLIEAPERLLFDL